MSRLIRLWSRFFLKASHLRTYTETLLLFMLMVLLTVLVYQSNTGYVTTTSLIFLINPLSALYYSLRTRIPLGRWYRRMRLDAAWLIVPALLLNIVVWLTARMLFADMLTNSDDLQVID